ncbi:hypothetical protein BJF84_15450 [Rhodococcus sp. CUA-806]|nr:hypothetical protein BJF84_25885 [Rhodococcus sp. CUA-806]OLT34958.1 hypothetical protein BJF84_15450 [Rhodococcus sp. CUA-806]
MIDDALSHCTITTGRRLGVLTHPSTSSSPTSYWAEGGPKTPSALSLAPCIRAFSTNIGDIDRLSAGNRAAYAGIAPCTHRSGP